VRPIRTAVVAATVSVLGLGLLAGCGDDEGSAQGTGDYCADLDAVQKDLSSASGGELGDLEGILDKLETLKDEAPEAIADDWDTLYTAYAKIVKTYQDAGFSAEDMAAVQNGQVPDGVDQQALLEVSSTIADIGKDPALQSAVADIQKHAEDECDLTLQ
jgi:hypothetical protein